MKSYPTEIYMGTNFNTCFRLYVGDLSLLCTKEYVMTSLKIYISVHSATSPVVSHFRGYYTTNPLAWKYHQRIYNLAKSTAFEKLAMCSEVHPTLETLNNRLWNIDVAIKIKYGAFLISLWTLILAMMPFVQFWPKIDPLFACKSHRTFITKAIFLPKPHTVDTEALTICKDVATPHSPTGLTMTTRLPKQTTNSCLSILLFWLFIAINHTRVQFASCLKGNLCLPAIQDNVNGKRHASREMLTHKLIHPTGSIVNSFRMLYLVQRISLLCGLGHTSSCNLANHTDVPSWPQGQRMVTPLGAALTNMD